MERRVSDVTTTTAIIFGSMRAAVPAADGEVEATDEGHRIIDDDDLLVVRGGNRMRVVLGKTNTPPRPPAEAVEKSELAVGAEHQRVIPFQDIDPQSTAATYQPVEKIAELRWRCARPVVEGQGSRAVEVPRQDGDRLARPLGSQRESPKILLAVDQQADS